MYKIGDKLYCYNSIYEFEFDIFYIVIDVNIMINSVTVSDLSEDVYFEFHYNFGVNKDYVFHHSDYVEDVSKFFLSVKEYRKMKIDKLESL